MLRLESVPRLEGVVVASVFAILGIVAVPIYKEHVLRQRVGELVNAATQCRSAVAEYYVLYGRLPASAAEAGCPDRVTREANPLAVFRGEVIVQAVGALATQLGRNNLFAFRAICADGACEGGRMLGWSCAPTGEAASSTTISAKYLPSACR